MRFFIRLLVALGLCVIVAFNGVWKEFLEGAEASKMRRQATKLTRVTDK